MQGSKWIALGLALAACHCESGPAPARPLMGLQAAAPEADPAMQRHMRGHFAAVTELQAAIARGQLSAARDKAHWFATHDMNVPPGWETHVSELRDAALRIERAGDVETAGLHLGRLGRACSACHEARQASPAFAYEPLPSDDATLEAQMKRHQWAAARLWEGVVGPADQLWEEGARVMASARFDVAKSAHEKPNVEVIELAERLRAQATEAISITDRSARAVLYGQMIETCASCHAIVRPQPLAATDDD